MRKVAGERQSIKAAPNFNHDNVITVVFPISPSIIDCGHLRHSPLSNVDSPFLTCDTLGSVTSEDLVEWVEFPGANLVSNGLKGWQRLDKSLSESMNCSKGQTCCQIYSTLCSSLSFAVKL